MRMHGAALLMFAASLTALPQATVRPPTPLPSYKNLVFPPLRQVRIPNPQTFTLPNGIKVYLLEDHELPLVSGFALIRTGNLFDPNDKRGLATITGDVLRSGGTAAKTGDEIDEQLENLAASVESNIGETRGSLGFSCLKENTGEVMGIWRDFMTSAEFRQDKIDLIKTQIKSMIGRRNDEPSGIANREFQSLLYGRNSPYGWQIEYEHIDNIQRDDVVAFYKRYFFPANITVAVYGDFDAPEMKARLTSLFEPWNYQQPPVPRFPVLNARPEPGVFLAEKPDVTQTFFEIGHIGGLLSSKDYPALQVAGDILGSGFSSRLMRKVRTELGYAYSIGASWGAGFLHPGLFEISGSTKSASTADTIAVIQQELARLRSTEVTAAELKIAKDTVLNGFVFNFDTPAKTLNRLVTYDYYGYPRDFIFTYQKEVAAVTRADVLRVAREYLKPENLTIVAVGNPAEFGKPLDSLALPVHKIDLTIPEPKPAASTSRVDGASLSRGAELLALARKALGGMEKIAAVKDAARTSQASLSMGGNEMKARQVSRSIAPSVFRQDQELPFGKISVYFDGKSGWMAAPQGTQSLPGPVLKQVREEMFRELPGLLGAAEANFVGDSTIEIKNAAGDTTRMVIDEKTGMPLKQIYQSVQMGGAPQPVEEIYADWRDVDGIKLPFETTIMQNGAKFATVKVLEWKLNTGLKPEDLSQKPESAKKP